jgi:hypothetical protein
MTLLREAEKDAVYLPIPYAGIIRIRFAGSFPYTLRETLRPYSLPQGLITV